MNDDVNEAFVRRVTEIEEQSSELMCDLFTANLHFFRIVSIFL